VARVHADHGPLTVTPAELDAMWNDPANWRFAMVYSCSRDPRLLVPKRFGFGWTLNMGHRRARVAILVFLVVVIAIAVLPILFSMRVARS
jgi:uncharacterized membrane protein